jgi:hypothetical protein
MFGEFIRSVKKVSLISNVAKILKKDYCLTAHSDLLVEVIQNWAEYYNEHELAITYIVRFLERDYQKLKAHTEVPISDVITMYVRVAKYAYKTNRCGALSSRPLESLCAVAKNHFGVDPEAIEAEPN